MSKLSFSFDKIVKYFNSRILFAGDNEDMIKKNNSTLRARLKILDSPMEENEHYYKISLLPFRLHMPLSLLHFDS